MADPILNRKLIDFEGASKLYSDLRSKLEAGDSAQSTALAQHVNTTTGNPHNVTKADLGLENAENTADKDKNVATATKWAVKRTVNFDGTTTDVTGSFELDGSDNVSGINLTVKDNSHSHTIDNITDLKTTLDGKFETANFGTSFTAELTKVKGKNGGLAELDDSGKVPQAQLPSYVDDVLEYDNKAAFPETGESGKIYVAKDDGKTYRWGGSAYVEISSSIVVGTTTGTAYDGKLGTDLATAVGTKGDIATVDTAFGRIAKNKDALGTPNEDSTTTAFGKIKKLEDAIGGSGGESLTDQIAAIKGDIAKIDLTKDDAKNVLSATKWTTARELELTGAVTGKVTGVDGSTNITVETTVDPTKHIHTTAQISDFDEKHATKLNTSTFKTEYTDKLGVASGVATLDADAKIAANNLHVATTTEVQESIIDAWKAPAKA